MPGDIQHLVAQQLSRAPDWIRRNLLSSELPIRRRAEEALAAIIPSALVVDPATAD